MHVSDATRPESLHADLVRLPSELHSAVIEAWQSRIEVARRKQRPRDRGGKDIFVHASALNRAGIAELGEDQRVAVDMVEGGKGPEALNIRLI
jgi:cold shock CspA family protein